MTRNAQSAGGSIAAVVGFLFVVYMLSPGPVMRLLYGPGGSRWPSGPPALDYTLIIIYVPIGFIADHVPFVSEFYVWYFKLWGVG